MDAGLYVLAAKDAIREKLYTYCRSMDRTDIPLGHTVFAEQSFADYGPYYQGDGRGFVDRLAREENKRCITESHQLTNISISVRGNQAGSEAYIIFTICIRDEAGKIHQSYGTGRFADDWELQNDEWFIVKRIFCQDFLQIRELDEAPSLFNGSKTHEDPSYRVLAR
jgi:hypothetical protein